MIKNFILVLCLVAVSFSSTFDIASVSTCTQQSTTGVCTRWEQNGSVIQTTGCFPAETYLLVFENGAHTQKQMSDIKIGDMVLTHLNNKDAYSPVVSWLHIQKQKEGKYLDVTTENGKFYSSHFHNIALLDKSYAFTKDLEGKTLFNGDKVLKVTNTTKYGIYAPLTENGNYYIKTNDSQKTLVHSYANVQNPEFYEPIVNIIFKIWEALFDIQSNYQVHPAAKWMKNTFSTIVEE